MRAFLKVIVIGFLLYSPPARATLSNYCYAWNDTAFWPTGPGVLPVFVSDGSSTSGASNLANALGLTQFETEMAVQRTLAIWNEQAGNSLKLRFVGVTGGRFVDGAITIYGDSVANGTQDVGAGAEARRSKRFISGVGWVWRYSQVIMYRKGGDGNPIPWADVPADPAHDIVTTIIHEIGHAAFNLGHPNSGAPYTDCQFGFPVYSVMGGPSRNLGNWDLELTQQRVGVRAQNSKFYRNYQIGSWMTAWQAAPTAGATPMYRMGSMPQDVSIRAFGFVDNGPGGWQLRDGGKGYQHSFARYQSRTLNPWYYLVPSLPRPVAVAATPAAGTGLPADMIFVYQYNAHPAVYHDAGNIGVICWKKSSDGGQTWGPSSCGPEVTLVYGLTAAYDPYSNSFLIGYVLTNGGFYNRIYITRVPAVGNPNPIITKALSISALHAPAIACNGAQFGCLLAYEQVNVFGTLGGTFIGVEDNFIQHDIFTSTSYTWGLIMHDTPGLAYVSTDNTFRLSVTLNNNATYSYSMNSANPGLGWTGTGDIWNDANSQISSAALSFHEFGVPATKRLGAWFLKYW